MRFTTAKYTRRVNMGNYEHEELSLEAALAETDDTQKAGVTLKQNVEKLLGLREKIDFADVKEVQEGGKIVMNDGQVKDAAETEVQHKEEPKEKKKPAKKNATKDKPKKEEKPKPKPAVKYDRSIDGHRKELSAIFDELRPGWNIDDATKKICAGISHEIVGEYIFDDHGEIIPEFKNKVEELLIEGEEGGL